MTTVRWKLALTIVLAAAVAALLLKDGCADPTPDGTGAAWHTSMASPTEERPRPSSALTWSPARTPRAARPTGEVDLVRVAPELDDPLLPIPPLISLPDRVPEVPGEIPEGDRGTGGCSLVLDFRDRATDRKAQGWARLWRLGVPADAKWPAGDHVQKRVSPWYELPEVKDLPPGRYRLELLGAAPGEPDPPEFVVQGPRTEMRVVYAEPPNLPVRVRLFDAQGRPVLAAQVRHGGGSDSTRTFVPAPDWASPRNGPPRKDVPDMWSFRSLVASHVPWIDAHAGPDGAFVLGELRAPARAQVWNASWTVRAEGCPDLSVRADSENLTLGDLVAVAVAWPSADSERVQDRVRLPDGRTAREAGAKFTPSKWAVLRADAGDAEPWRKAKASVRVSLAGFEDLDLVWLPAGPDPDPVTLVPKSPR